MHQRDLGSIAFRFVGLLLLVRLLAGLPYSITLLRQSERTGFELGAADLVAALVLLSACTALVLGGGRFAEWLFRRSADREVELGAGPSLLAVGAACVGLWYALHFLGTVGAGLAWALRSPPDSLGTFGDQARRAEWLSIGWDALLCAGSLVLLLRAGALAAWWEARRARAEAPSAGGSA